MPGVNTANGLGWTAGQICWVSSVISISILLWLHLNNALGFLIRIRITKNGKYLANRGGEAKGKYPCGRAIACNDIADRTGYTGYAYIGLSAKEAVTLDCAI